MWAPMVVTPLMWLYVPVRMPARLGSHSELVTAEELGAVDDGLRLLLGLV